jgi:cytochrome c biogenesis protein CcdA
MDEVARRRRSQVRFAAVAAGVLVIGIAGYVGFVAFVESDREVGAGVLVLGAATGFAAFFSPCSFPLLLTFLTKRSVESRKAAFLSALRVGAGAAVFLAIVGGVIAGGGSSFSRVVEFDSLPGRVFRFTIGLTLVTLGLGQARLLNIRMRWFDRVAGVTGRLLDPSRVSGRARTDVMYGFGYLLAGFG